MAKTKSGKSMVGILTAIGRFWMHYFDFMGRATRSEYWFAILFVAIVVGAMSFVSLAVRTVALLVLFTPCMSLTVRRFRDARVSVYFYIIPMLIIFGLPLIQRNLWIAYINDDYMSSGLILWSAFLIAFAIFKVVVACLPSRK